jgi:hypothetical protein
MVKVTRSGANSTSKPRRPALTPEARDNQLISLAYDAAQKQLEDGSASSQVITHFLKLGTAKAELEKEKLARENELLRAKTESLQSSQRIEELYTEAIKAMQRYSGRGSDDYEDEY